MSRTEVISMAYRNTRAIELRKDARRRTLLEAATRLFSTCGYHAATVPMIVAEARSSVGCFYTYFRNKEDIFAVILGTFGKEIEVVIREARESRSDPLLQMHCALEAGLLYLAQNPREARMLIVDSSGLSHRLEQLRKSIFWHQADECCRILIASTPQFLTVNPLISARCLVGSVVEVLRCWLEESPNDRLSPADLARAVVDFNLRALLR